MENRRNYYRILNVQPDAPAEIIRASYLTLLRELKKHPDLGGDGFNAAVINEAYETLSNIRKRSDYDKELLESYMINGLNRRIADRKSIKQISPVKQTHSAQTLLKEPVQKCHVTKDNHAQNMTKKHDRRAVHRIDKNGTIHYEALFLQTDHEAKIQDLSPQGIRFTTKYKLPSNWTVKIKSPFFNALARIIRSESGQLNGKTIYSIGALFLNVKFKNPKGSFYSRVIDEACV